MLSLMLPDAMVVHATTLLQLGLPIVLHGADPGRCATQWSMWDRIQGVRNQELSTLWRSFIIQALFGFTLNTIPVLVSVLTFGIYVLLGNKLTAAEAFTSLSLFTVSSCFPPPARLAPPASPLGAVLYK